LVHFIQWLRSIRHGADSAQANENRLSERTVNIIVSTVSSFYRYHIQHGAQLDNPVLLNRSPIASASSNDSLFILAMAGRSNVAPSSKCHNDGSRP
jgi:site-specific recombinase XerD